MDIQIVCTERIKPRPSPASIHPKSFNLCLLDHLIPAAYAPIVLFYPNRGLATPVDVLKCSLAEVLARFFPLAGAIRDDDDSDTSIDCIDKGACFVTTKVGCSLTEFLGSPDLKLLSRFLPCGGPCVTNIQGNVFACGGIAIGVCVSHRIADGASLSTFLKAWANAATSGEAVSPDFSASSLFPVEGSWFKDTSMEMWGRLFKEGQFVTKRFVFDHSAIASLRNMAGGTSRVIAVSAFIWKHAMAAFGKPAMVTHVVNLRKRAVPNFPGESMGNLIWITAAKCDIEDRQLPELGNELRKSVMKIDGEYIDRLRGNGGRDMMVEDVTGIGLGGEYLGFTSWCKMGFYDVDFGWGKPVWVSSIDSSGPFFMNLVVLMDTRCGDGIEAWITLDEQDMFVLENDGGFTSFASFNPSPVI